MKHDRTVFDLGFHNGDDTDFYLAKGYRVIAVEANERLVEEGRGRFPSAIASGRLVLVNKAVAAQTGHLKFYIHPFNSDWSSCYHHIVTSDGSQPAEVAVEATTLLELYALYGVPHYLKVDIEGADIHAVKQLAEHAVKPKYVSFETSKRDFAALFSYLYVAGYRQYQLINQANNHELLAHVEALDGMAFDYCFSKYSSGLFGDDLLTGQWRSFEETLTNYIKYKELKQIDNRQLGLGWVDVHARFES